MSPPPFIRRVQLTNYKSIEQCDVELGPLTFLVGPNGAGKSNFLDALAFVRDALRTTLDHAIRDRGGISEVRRRSRGHPTNFRIKIQFTLPDDRFGHYEFRIGSKPRGQYAIQREECWINYPDGLTRADGSVPDYGVDYFSVRGGRVSASVSPLPPVTSDRLMLVALGGFQEFEDLYTGLIQSGFYNLNPAVLRSPQPPQAGDVLASDGANIASVLGEMIVRSPDAKRRVEEFLATVVPGVQGVDPQRVGRSETLEFRQVVKGSEHPWRFLAHMMSDGTLRALGVLVALYQPANPPWNRIPLVGIEEPELALHPAAAATLLEALLDASATTQVVVTSHSPDLLDDPALDASAFLAVVSRDGNTEIGPINEAARSALLDRLYTAGELLRLDELAPSR